MGKRIHNKPETYHPNAKKDSENCYRFPYLAHTEPLMKEHKFLNVTSVNIYGRAQVYA